MRTEKEMMDLIIDTAKADHRIRAAYMNGSRTNPHVPKDIFQDYDIVYVVTETASFIRDENWVNTFGDLLMMQEPDRNDKATGKPVNIDRSYGYLMLFTDGNRIDLHIETKEVTRENYVNDKLTIPLLDKDHILPQIPAPTDIDYHIKKPVYAAFHSCCNDFWWCLQNVAKGLWRDELPYAKQMFEYEIRSRLDEMVSWWIGNEHDFDVSSGKMGKYFKRYLPESHWKMYVKTYASHNYEYFWKSIFITCELFRTLAKDLAVQWGFTYPEEDDSNMTKYLQQVRQLPPDAVTIF
ncbi:aminoglycoside 6-adenylyltransferase [Virgibacillus kimchii]